MFMIHLCLLLCCVYVVLCWFFTSLVYVRLLASDLVPIDEALWVYLTDTYCWLLLSPKNIMARQARRQVAKWTLRRLDLGM